MHTNKTPLAPQLFSTGLSHTTPIAHYPTSTTNSHRSIAQFPISNSTTPPRFPIGNLFNVAGYCRKAMPGTKHQPNFRNLQRLLCHPTPSTTNAPAQKKVTTSMAVTFFIWKIGVDYFTTILALCFAPSANTASIT